VDAADVLHLENGDQLSGEITGMTDGVITLETAYAGTLSIRREAVVGLESEGSIALRQADGTVLEGSLSGVDGTLELLTEDGPRPLILDEVEAMAPSLEALAAQAPAEDAPEEEGAPRRWSGSVESGLSMRRGNTDTLDFSLGATAVRKGDGHTLTLNALAAYGEADDIINTRQFKADAHWKIYHSERFYYYGLVGAERSDGRKLDLRLNTAVGLGRDFIETERHQLSADLGVDFTMERWAPFTPAERSRVGPARRAEARRNLQGIAVGLADGSVVPSLQVLQQAAAQWGVLQDPLYENVRKEEFLSLRLSTNYSRKVFDSSTISTKLAGFANLDDFGEYRLTNDLAFQTPLSDTLKLRINLKSEYDSLAGDSGIDPWDHLLTTSLRYEF